MNEFKILSGLELVNYRYPLTDVSHLSVVVLLFFFFCLFCFFFKE